MGGWAKRACYGTSKAAVVALTQILGVEWIKHGIRVNAINPGQIETPFNEAAFKAGLGDREVFTNRAPMRRFGDARGDRRLRALPRERRVVQRQRPGHHIDGGWMAWGSLTSDDPLGIRDDAWVTSTAAPRS